MLVGAVLDNPVTRYVARVSFGLYIVPDIDHGQMEDTFRMLIFGGAIVAVTFVIAHVSFHFFENPIMRWAPRLEQPAPAVLKLA